MLHGISALRVALITVAAFFLLVLAFAFVRSGNVPSQQAIGQEGTGQETTEGTTAPDPQFELPPLEPLPQREDPLSDQYEAAIPGLAVMDVRGFLNGAPPGGIAFDCPGTVPDGALITWRCASTSGGPAAYEVRLVGDDPRTICSVTATAYNTPDDAAAAEFLSYVANLAVEDTDPINAEVWVKGNVPSGGSYLAKGASLRLYGYPGARTLEVVATGL
jgi:hypothetical protein